jgi:hypothetical protein
MTPSQFPQKTCQKATSHTRRLREIRSEILTLGNIHANKVPSRIKDPRTTMPEQHLKTIIQQLGHQKQIEPKGDNTRPRPLSSKVMYVFYTTGVRLGNHPLSLVICLEQPESISQTFPKPPT